MMSEVFALRRSLDEARLELEATRVEADGSEVALRILINRIKDGTFVATHENPAKAVQKSAEAELASLRAKVQALSEQLAEVKQKLAAELDGQKPLFRNHSAEPIALLPVRLETRFADASTIQVRVFPDDVQVESFDPRLTPAELRAAHAYWRKPGDKSWRRLLEQLSPARAAWAKRATRPNAPEKPQQRKPSQRRSPRVSTMPTRWRFLGFVDGELVVDERGEEVPTPLPLGVLVGGEGEQATWLVDFEAAEKVGMAITLKLPEGVEHLDELFAVGVQQSTAAEASERLRDTLMGHAFGSGLAFLSPGTPTNNTPESRSAWSSHPWSERPRLKRLKAESDAARLARAIGLPKPGFLGDCPGARQMTEHAVAGLTLLSWGALGQGAVHASQGADLNTGTELPADRKAWRDVREHLIGNVRGRGPLPTIRIGNQPYGVLPTTSLDEWVPGETEGPTELIAAWLLRLRRHWRTALASGWIPQVSDGALADRAAVAVLSRLPTTVDLAVRRLRSPAATMSKVRAGSRPPGMLEVSGIAAGANLRWTVPTELIATLSSTGEATKADYSLVGARLDPKPEDYAEVLSASRELLSDALAVARGKLSAAKYEKRWPLELSTRKGNPPARRDTLFALEGEYPGFLPALLDPVNWTVGEGDLGPRDPFREALELPAAVDTVVRMELDPAAPGDAKLRKEARKDARQKARQAPRMVKALGALEATPPRRLLPLALEVLDVYSHRLDAWITSLATRRLHAIRHTKSADASRIGGYGWVENLRRDADTGADLDGYVHAPSLQHAATAAVLRSGFRAHRGDRTLAVKLDSRRARTARWLLGGVRRGQELGSLLGYRFERALHDAGHDELIDDFRIRYPLPLSPEPEPEDAAKSNLWGRSSKAVAARNVVDGMALARDADNAKKISEDTEPMVADLVDALDAVGDLLLAESVHHLVGGNAMRAGLSADSLGRGEDVPDRFDVLRSPSRGRAITHRVATVLPPAPKAPGGWRPDDLAALEPRVEAWVADAIGPASSRRLTGVLVDADGGETKFERGAEELGFGALTTALEVSGAEHTRLAGRIVALEKAPGSSVRFEGAAWVELRGVANRVRSLLASAQPLLPPHLAAGPAAAEISANLGEVRDRVAAFAATLPGRSRRDTAPGRLAKLAKQKPDAEWLKTVATTLAEILGTGLPLAPLLVGAKLGASPADIDGAELADWVRRSGSVRPAVGTWHELLLLTGIDSGRACPLRASQSPTASAAERWVGGAFPPAKRPVARQQIVCHIPAPLPASAALAGIVFDEWVELLPGSDTLAEATPDGEPPLPPESELTGLSFHFDRPDAKAPQAILLAVPPNPKRGWTGDTLALVVRDTLELAKLRAVDLGDLPMLDDVLPGIRLDPLSPLAGLARDYWNELAR
jgi:hypothetical protein